MSLPSGWGDILFFFFFFSTICLYGCHLISSQSLNLGGRRVTTDDVATIPFHPSLSSAALWESPIPIYVYSLMLSSVSSSVFLSFLLFSLPPAELSLPCWSILRCGHTIRISVSLPWLGDHHALHCILDSLANLLVRHVVFVGNVLKSAIASRFKSLDPSFDFCCPGPALTGIKEGG